MELQTHKRLVIGVAIFLPIVLQMFLIVLERAFLSHVPWYGSSWSVVISLLTGFCFLVAAFRWYAFAIAFLYCPLMWFVLVYVSFLIYGESL
jgi:hypothetical protein